MMCISDQRAFDEDMNERFEQDYLQWIWAQECEWQLFIYFLYITYAPELVYSPYECIDTPF